MKESDLQRLSEIVQPVVVEWRRLPSSEDQAVGLDCPECEGPVRMAKVRSARDDRVVLDVCDRCGGVWLDLNELRAIQQDSLLALAAGFLRPASGGR
jgi:Zn-finger nucleic acid-binding protein